MDYSDQKHRIVSLGSLIKDIAMGPFGSNLKVDSFVKAGVPVIKGGNLYGPEVGGSFSFVNEEKASSLKRSLAYPDDIVITHRGTLGQVSIVPSARYPYYLTSQSQLRLTVDNERILPRYLLYYLRSSLGQNELMQHASQVGVPSIATPTKAVKSLKILLPSLDVQHEIAKIVGVIDKKIELNRQMNKTLEQIGQAFFEQCLGMDAYSHVWPIGKIGDFVNIKGGGTPSTKNANFWDGDIAWTSPKDLAGNQGAFLLSTAKRITSNGLAKISSGLLPESTLLLSSRAPIGYVAIAALPVAINQGYIAFLPDAELSNYFMYFWVKRNMQTIKGAANGSTFMEISKSSFRNLTVKVPPKDLRLEFDKQMEPYFQRMLSCQQEVETLTSLRDYLLPRLMDGTIGFDE